MPTGRQGSIHLFRFSGIDVFLHWSWFLVAAYEIQTRKGSYSSVTWNVLEYLALFLIVLIHEFGHALACRQVGGRADRIVLWPLGGVAYVDPPPRPGATLWSIAAGPLVNVVLLPVFYVLVTLGGSSGWAETMPDLYRLLLAVQLINKWLLIFNILAHLSTGWRPDPSLLALVCARTRSQFDGRHDLGLDRSGRIHRSRHLGAIRLVRSNRGLHADELLERPATRAGSLAPGKVAASGRFCLSDLQDGSAGGRILDSAESADNPSTCSKPTECVLTARRSTPRQSAWTADDSIP